MKKIIKRISIAIAMLIVLIVFAAGGLFYQMKKKGGGSIEAYIGSQIISIVNSYLNPQLSFDDLDYEYPLTVRAKNLKFTSIDPVTNERVEIISAAAAEIQLAEIPQMNKPIVIEKIAFDQPQVRLIARSEVDSSLIGFDDFVKDRPGRPSPATTQSNKDKFSDILKIRQIDLKNGKVVYDCKLPDVGPMELDQITTTLHIKPTEAGVYRVDTVIERKPVFRLNLAGAINLDTIDLTGIDVKLNADLSEGSASYLPPQLQDVLTKHEVGGKLDWSVSGDMPQADVDLSNLTSDIQLADANLAFGEYHVPIEKLMAAVNLVDGKVLLPTLHANAFHGAIDASGEMALNDNLDTKFKLELKQVGLRAILKAQGEKPKIAGLLDANVSMDAPLAVVVAKNVPTTQRSADSKASQSLPEKWGSGRVQMEKGKLPRLPIFEQLEKAIATTVKELSGNREKSRGNDSGLMLFAMEGDYVRFDEITFVTPTYAVRGRGRVGLDESLDLKLNGGPIERMQHLLGDEIGGFFGKITDAIAGYIVTGTLTEPKVRVEVAGGIGSEIGKGVKEVGKGIGEVGKEVGKVFEKK